MPIDIEALLAITPRELKAFLLQLEETSRLTAKRKGDDNKPNFKRSIASYVLLSAALFYKANNAPERIINAISEVAHGLRDLNMGKPTEVLTAPLAANETTSTIVMFFRADIAALHYAIIKGAPSDIQEPTSRESTVLILKGLGKELNKVLRTNDTAQRPGLSIKNLLADFINALKVDPSDKTSRKRIRMTDDIVAEYFSQQRRRYSIDLLTLDIAERKRRINGILRRLKAEIASKIPS